MLILDISVNLMDLLLGLLCIAGIVALVALAMIFFRLAQNLKAISGITEMVKPEIQQILTDIKPTAAKIDNIVGDVQKITAAAGQSVPQLVDSVSKAGETLTDTVGLLGEGAYSAANTIKTLIERGEKKITRGRAKSKHAVVEISDDETVAIPGLNIELGKQASSNPKLSQIAGAAIGTYRFVQKLRKAKKKADRKRKFGF